ncbi:MAG: hypothetical protein K9G46_00770 [Flavobacteriales bacterium]|jgi:hypothetical protein|nr:hypothetical protein [Flavobacteriales bacterium]
MNQSEQYQSIVVSLKEKSTHKLKVLEQATHQFELLKTEAEKLANELNQEIEGLTDVNVNYTQKGSFQAELKFGEDVIIFFLHNDVFDFERSHHIWKISYVEKNRLNAYCGMISIFNFLNTSFEMNRLEDLGYLVGRIFINADNHYFVEGKKQLGFLFNDFSSSQLDSQSLRSVIMTAIQYCQEFDLLTPPFSSMSQVQVGQMMDISNQMSVKTGKRLGFKFSTEQDSVE